jgi:hypothetical protein
MEDKNECFNALKNNGYELTHNWGHVKGESFAIYNLIMLAFYIRQILELTDYLFKKCREISRTFKNLWTDLNYHLKVGSICYAFILKEMSIHPHK